MKFIVTNLFILALSVQCLLARRPIPTLVPVISGDFPNPPGYGELIDILDPDNIRNFFKSKLDQLYDDILSDSESRERYRDLMTEALTLLLKNKGHYKLVQKFRPFDCENYHCGFGLYPTKFQIAEFKYSLTDNTIICRENSNFNERRLASIEKELAEKWSKKSLSESTFGSSPTFRTRWEYGGSCSGYFKEMDYEFKYFNKSLELFGKYEVGSILSDESIFPQEAAYTAKKLSDVISRGFDGKKVRLGCVSRLTEPRKYFLHDVELHFDASFNPIDYKESDYPSTLECPDDEVIFYDDNSRNLVEINADSIDIDRLL